MANRHIIQQSHMAAATSLLFVLKSGIDNHTQTEEEIWLDCLKNMAVNQSIQLEANLRALTEINGMMDAKLSRLNDPPSDLDNSIQQGGGGGVDRVGRGANDNDVRWLPRPRFDALEMRKVVNLREINSLDALSFNILLGEMFSSIAAIAASRASPNDYMHMILRGASLVGGYVFAHLSANDGYTVDQFIQALGRAMQSNKIATDNTLEEVVLIVHNQSGGGKRRSLSSYTCNQVITRKIPFLYAPLEIVGNLCFSICVSHFLNPSRTDNEIIQSAQHLYAAIRFDEKHCVDLSDIGTFETFLGVKIVVFYRGDGVRMPFYQTTDAPHPHTVHSSCFCIMVIFTVLKT